VSEIEQQQLQQRNRDKYSGGGGGVTYGFIAPWRVVLACLL